MLQELHSDLCVRALPRRASRAEQLATSTTPRVDGPHGQWISLGTIVTFSSPSCESSSYMMTATTQSLRELMYKIGTSQTLMTRESFCKRLSSRSPCLMVVWYCAFLRSGRVLLTTPFTLSILQLSREVAMKPESSCPRRGWTHP